MLLHQTCYILKNLPSCYSALSKIRAQLKTYNKKKIYYFSHLSHCTLISFSLTDVTSSLISSFLFSHWSHFFSLFFIHQHPQLKTTAVVVVLKFFFFFFFSMVVVLVDCLGFFFFFFCLEVACDSNGGCFGWQCWQYWFILMGFVVSY